MRINSTYKLVWNRKNKTGSQIVQIEILFPNRKRKYIGTGIKITTDQWDAVNRQVKGTILAAKLNRELSDKVTQLQSYELDMIDKGIPFNHDAVDRFTGYRIKQSSFTEFCLNQLKKRNIGPGTHRKHELVIGYMKDVGITTFDDLTFEKIAAFDRHIRSMGSLQTTIADRHNVLKLYIGLAIKTELLPSEKNPYNKFKVQHGHSKIRTRLDDEEIIRIINATMPTKATQRARDYYLFQLYTGLSYSDLRVLMVANIRTNGSDYWMEGLRKKSGELYTAYLIPDAVKLIEKYSDGVKVFPKVRSSSNQNDRLVDVAKAAGINKTITCHSARHSYSSWMIRKGVSLAVIQQTLGHSSITTTMQYAKLERGTIKAEILRAFSQS